MRSARRASHVEFAFTLLKRRRGKVSALIYYITLYTRENGRGGGGDRISGIRPQNITFGGEDGSFNLKQVNDIDGGKKRRFFTFTAESPKGWEFRILLGVHTSGHFDCWTCSGDVPSGASAVYVQFERIKPISFDIRQTQRNWTNLTFICTNRCDTAYCVELADPMTNIFVIYYCLFSLFSRTTSVL